VPLIFEKAYQQRLFSCRRTAGGKRLIKIASKELLSGWISIRLLQRGQCGVKNTSPSIHARLRWPHCMQIAVAGLGPGKGMVNLLLLFHDAVDDNADL
jgi:hypothetical protein